MTGPSRRPATSKGLTDPAHPRPTRRTGALRRVNAEPGEPLMRGAITLLNLIMRSTTRHTWTGQNRIPADGGVVIVANHISNVDPLVLGQFLAYSGRWPRYLAKSDLFSVPVLGRFLGAIGQIPVKRDSRSAGEALSAAVEAVRAGRAVIVYPEGTITGDDHLWPMAGKTGAARIAFQTGCPVIPVGQWGAQSIMYGRQVHLPHLWPVVDLKVLAGDPVPLDDLRSSPVTSASLIAATDRMMTAITALVEQLREESAPEQRFDPRAAGGSAR